MRMLTWAVFERVLWLNPNDNPGARFSLTELKQERAWSQTGLD